MHGLLTDTNPEYFSLSNTPSDSSFAGELSAFLYVLQRDLLLAQSSPPSSPSDEVRFVIWASDNEGACHAVNSGRTHSEGEAEAVLRQIFSIAATLNRSLLAVWIPRLVNTISDGLSHYAASLGVNEISGRFSQLPSHITGTGDLREGTAYSE